MDPFEIREALNTFRIIADTREQRTPRASRRFKAFGCPVERGVLDYGDYCANITLPGGDLLDPGGRLRPVCVVERKMGLDELAMCFTWERDRFQREFERARDFGARVYLLTENGSFEAIAQHRYRSKLTPAAFQASLIAWSIRYGFVPLFCKADSSGRVIKEFLYRDMKERLEHGEYG